MAKFIGRKVDVGLGKESSRGVGVSATYWMPKVDISFDDKIVQARSNAGVGTLEDSEEAFVTTKYAEGTVDGEIRDKSMGLLLLSLLGSVSTAGPTDSAYTHSFSLQDDAQHDSLTVVVKDPNVTEAYRLGMVSSIEFRQNLDEVAMFTAGFVSKTAKGASATPTYTKDYKFTKKHLVFKVADSVANLASATAISLKSLTFSINANASIDDTLGTAEPEDILNKQFSVEGQITLNYEDATWKEYMREGTARAVQIAWINTDETIGTGTNPSLAFQMPNVDFYDWTPNYALDEIVSQQISFKASRDLTNGAGMIQTCQLVNEVVSY